MEKQRREIILSIFENNFSNETLVRLLHKDIICICLDYLVEYYNDKGEEGFTFNGKEEGVWKEYFNNGRLYIQNIYVNGRLNGEQNKWYSNGQLWTQVTYVNDKKEGEWKSWYDKGSHSWGSQLWTQGTYVKDKKEGIWKEWHPNGQLRKQGNYKDGKKREEWKSWNSNGVLDILEVYSSEGKKVYTFREI